MDMAQNKNNTLVFIQIVQNKPNELLRIGRRGMSFNNVFFSELFFIILLVGLKITRFRVLFLAIYCLTFVI